jgi:hypothetical protein
MGRGAELVAGHYFIVDIEVTDPAGFEEYRK